MESQKGNKPKFHPNSDLKLMDQYARAFEKLAANADALHTYAARYVKK